MTTLKPTSEQLAARLTDLPALPGVVADLVASIEDDDVDLDTLAAKIERDQALASKTLRIANSPFFGLTGHIGSIQEAATVIGLRTIRSLALASSVGTLTTQALRGNLDVKAFWVHAFQTAIAARELASSARVSPEQAFVAGLLHDVGKLAFGVLEPDLLTEIKQHCEENRTSWEDAEAALSLPDHGEVGGALARRWHFPEALCEAIALHHKDDAQHSRLAQVIQVSEALAKAYGVACGDEASIVNVSAHAWNVVAPSDKALLRAVRGLRKAADIAANVV